MLLRNFLISLLIISMTACEGESKETESLKTALCTADAQQHWPGGSALGSGDSSDNLLQDADIEGKLEDGQCRALFRLSGLAFKNTQAAYLCRSYWPSGDFWTAENPPPVTQESAALLLGNDAERTALESDLLPEMRFAGKAFAAVLLYGDETVTTITRTEQLKEKLETITSAAGAVSWAFLMGELGEGYQPKALCEAEIKASEKGYMLTGADVFYNCQPRKIRNLTIGRDGLIVVTKDADKKDAEGNSVALCID